MMNGFLYLKNKNENLKKEKEEIKNKKNHKKLKNYNNKIANNYYHRVKEFINQMEKNPMIINDFNPLKNKIKKATIREKNLLSILKNNKYSFFRSKTYVEIKPKINIKEDLNILFNNNKIKENITNSIDINKDKELKLLIENYKKINKLRIKNERNISNKLKKNKKNKTDRIKNVSENKIKKTYFESIITLMYKNKDILYHNKINNEDVIKKRINFKNTNKLSERVAFNVLIKCNKFNKKFVNNKIIRKPFIIRKN